MHRITRCAAVAACSIAALPAAAPAHVTLQPAEVPAGDFKRLDVRVPNERDDASTTKVTVRFPPGFLFVSHERVPGWTTQVKMAKLDRPVEVFGEERTEEVDTVTFTTRGDGIGPGEFQDFGLSVGLPDRPNSTLSFKALQEYSSGEVVRWIGAPDSDEPAPEVRLTAAAGAKPVDATSASTSAAPAPAAGGGDDGGGDGLAIAALVVGGLGLLAGLAGFLAARRSRATVATATA